MASGRVGVDRKSRRGVLETKSLLPPREARQSPEFCKQGDLPTGSRIHFSEHEDPDPFAGDPEVAGTKLREQNCQMAHAAIRGLVKRPGRKKQKNLRAYHCPVYSGWHLTS